MDTNIPETLETGEACLYTNLRVIIWRENLKPFNACDGGASGVTNYGQG